MINAPAFLTEAMTQLKEDQDQKGIIRLIN